jgi:eukaryotic-like serine/threonine-protein kinase
MMSFERGRTYSGYEFLEIANQTGATIVWRVRNTLADRLELLYVLSETAADDPQRRERFMREMRLRARLLHPNIPGFLNATELNGHLVLTTELVKGRPLAELLKSGPLPVPDACRLAEQLLSALACAHEFGIVHRDVNPESILVTPEGSVELSNFGMAKGLSSPQLTQAGAIFGNAGYISPEQARGAGELDCRSDIYSVGAVLFHMLCGRPPFVGAGEFDLMLAHVKQAPAPPGSYHAAVPPALDAVVLKALAKDPAGRYPSCTDFAEALAAASLAPPPMRASEAKPALEAKPVSQAAPPPFAATAPRRAAPPPLLYGAGAVLAVLLLVVWFFVRK